MPMQLSIQIKRVYQAASPDDGLRILVDRLWPRGQSKEGVQIDHWLKDIAPSTALRQAFHQGLLPWAEFRQHYLQELEQNPEAVAELRQHLQHKTVTLVYGAKDPEQNHALILKAFLESPPQD